MKENYTIEDSVGDVQAEEMDLALTSHIEDRLQGKQTSYGKKNKTKKQTEIASMEGNDFDQFNI